MKKKLTADVIEDRSGHLYFIVVDEDNVPVYGATGLELTPERVEPMLNDIVEGICPITKGWVGVDDPKKLNDRFFSEEFGRLFIGDLYDSSLIARGCSGNHYTIFLSRLRTAGKLAFFEKGCNHCEDHELLGDFWIEKITDEYYLCSEDETILISYCPMCGRELK